MNHAITEIRLGRERVDSESGLGVRPCVVELVNVGTDDLRRAIQREKTGVLRLSLSPKVPATI